MTAVRFFTQLGQEATIRPAVAPRDLRENVGTFVRDLFDQITQNAQSAIQ